ncbi:hypothetical protein T484DRAFT_1764623, partial [Baffinella frigidus]
MNRDDFAATSLPRSSTDASLVAVYRKLVRGTDASLIKVCRKLLDRVEPYEGDSRLAALVGVLRRHAGGLSALVWAFHDSLFESYVSVESRFSGRLDAREEVIMEM